MALRGIAPRRDQLIAAGLTGAVVIVVGYASGLGLKPGTAAGSPPVLAQPQTPPSAATPLPGGEPPAPAPIPSLPAVPVTDIPAPVAPPASPPGGIEVPPPAPVPDPVPPHPHPDPPSSTPPLPPPPPPPPPGTELPACQPGAAQQVLDTVAALPLLGGVTGGLGVSGADGLGAALLGYCRAPDGTVVLENVPAPVR
ncbi:hypothetical protein [Amycolatopsis orientalis]|uniref:hypothetical protein n=1 Tax=Amycolatopsis orientalis TaxID=31958 RepID=UPI000AA6370F|nr:hypothetical protein [Amycolatopsis orientalis]